MHAYKRVRAALAVAVASSLALPGFAVADEKPAQPGTVRPSEKAQAQPGTSKKDAPAKEPKKQEEPAKPAPVAQPEVKPAPKPAPAPAPAPTQAQPAPVPQPTNAPASKPAPAPAAPVAVSDQAASAPAPVSQASPAVRTQPVSNTRPVSNTAPVVKDSTTAVNGTNGQAFQGESMADKATETVASKPVRESVAASENAVEETKPVRTAQADEAARYELAAAIDEDGDVREQAVKDEPAVTREGDNEGLAPVDAPEDDGDDDTDDGQGQTTEQVEVTPVSQDGAAGAAAPVVEDAPHAEVTEVAAGAAVDTSAGTASVAVEASQSATEFSATSQQAGAESATEYTAVYDATTHSVGVDVAGTQFEVAVPEAPVEVTAAVEQFVPNEVAEVVDQSIAQAEQAVAAHVASLPTGEQVTDTAVGQVSTWLNVK